MTATQDLVVLEGTNQATAAVTWWSLRGTTELVELRSEWEGEGLDPELLPPTPSEHTRLDRALKEALSSRYRTIQLDRKTCSWQVDEVLVDPAKKEAKYRKVLTVSLTEEVKVAGEHKCAEGSSLLAKIADSFQSQEGTLTALDVSLWLYDRARALHALPLRDRGGFYLLPAESLPAWEEQSSVLMSCSEHKIAQLPVMRSAQAVACMMDAVEEEARRAFAEFEEYMGGEVSKRGLTALERKLSELSTRVSAFTDQLAAKLPNFEERSEKLRGAISAARISSTQ